MEIFTEYLAHIDNLQNRARMEEILHWVAESFPGLGTRIAWNQPMFTDHDTFIIAFSVAKKHFSVAPEKAAINRFAEEIAKTGYECGKELIKIPWDGPVDYSLLKKIIEFNISDKKECTTFWRK